jgi:hypothetical protein
MQGCMYSDTSHQACTRPRVQTVIPNSRTCVLFLAGGGMVACALLDVHIYPVNETALVVNGLTSICCVGVYTVVANAQTELILG